MYQARAQAPPPLEIEKQKKSHQSKFKAISPIFCYFFSQKYHFLCYLLSWAPLEKLKSKNESLSDFRPPPPPLINYWTRQPLCTDYICFGWESLQFNISNG